MEWPDFASDASPPRRLDDRIRASLARCYAGLGRKDEAIREAQRAVELVPISVDAISGTHRRVDLAAIYAAVGELERAIDEIEFLLSVPSLITPQILQIDPTWRHVRDHPRLQEVLAKYETANPVRVP